jgi:hypothetical protein
MAEEKLKSSLNLEDCIISREIDSGEQYYVHKFNEELLAVTESLLITSPGNN